MNKQLAALTEYQARQNMALKMFRPMEHQEPFYTKYARLTLLRGGNRAGKSVCAAAKFASKALDIPITLNDGTVIEGRQPWQKGRCLRMWVIGYDLKHIGQTIYRLLFKKGLFKIIKDKATGKYRAYRPWDADDAAREKDAREAPPLIPARFVKPNSWDWDNKKGKEFKSVTIIDPTTGEDIAEIFAYSSKGDPKAGESVDMIWIDEAIDNPEHFQEWKARLFDVRGELIWSSWPAAQNDALVKLSEEAKEQEGLPNPLVREHVIKLSENKSISKEKMDEAMGMFSTPEEKRARDAGEFVTDLLRMYPWFDEFTHQAIRDGDPDEVSRIIRSNGGIIPHDWTRELVIDPGSQNPAALFCAVPPPTILGACGSLSGVVLIQALGVKVVPDVTKQEAGGDGTVVGWTTRPNPKQPSRDAKNWLIEFDEDIDDESKVIATRQIQELATEWARRNKNRVGIDAFIVYDELAGKDVHRHNASQLARKIKEKAGDLRFNRMIIDYRGGRTTGMGYEVTAAENYRQALIRERVFTQHGDPWFEAGCDDIPARVGVLQEWMEPQDNGLPKLRIIRDKCPVLCKQLRQYNKKAVGAFVTEERPADRQTIDAAVALEYWAASSPAYVKPKVTPQDSALARVVAIRDKLRQAMNKVGGVIGPSYRV